MNNIFNICFIFLLINYYLVNCSSISDYRLVNRSLRNVQNEDNDEEENEDDSTDIESDQKSDQNNSKNGKEDKSSLTPIDSSEKSQSGTKLMIILVDGFRFDYVSRDKNLKGFPRIAKSGVRAEYVKPIFPPNSYPNWYSIVTGLYGESHGMFENRMFDRTLNDFFLMVPHPNASHSHWWDKSEPIWITAEKNGVKAALYLWDGCQVLIRGRKPTICVEYKSLYESNIAFNETKRYLDKILDDFSHDKYRLALLYYELVDHTGHTFGPRSRKTKQAVKDIDDILYDLHDSITKRQLDDKINVVIVSDHGMIQTDNANIIQIENILDFNDVEVFLGGGSLSQILPEDGKEEEVYKQLRQAKIKGLNVYKKENIPERFHFKNNKNVLPILITADKGYYIIPPNIKGKVYPERGDNESPDRGSHGYDADHVHEMRAIMYGFGPAFRKDYVCGPLEQVDHYNLFCHLIDIKPKPNNGTYSRIEKLLIESESNDNDESGQEIDDEDSDKNNENGVPIDKLNSILIYYFVLKFSYLMFYS